MSAIDCKRSDEFPSQRFAQVCPNHEPFLMNPQMQQSWKKCAARPGFELWTSVLPCRRSTNGATDTRAATKQQSTSDVSAVSDLCPLEINCLQIYVLNSI